MSRVGLVIRAGNQKVVARARELIKWCADRNLELLVDGHVQLIFELRYIDLYRARTGQNKGAIRQ